MLMLKCVHPESVRYAKLIQMNRVLRQRRQTLPMVLRHRLLRGAIGPASLVGFAKPVRLAKVRGGAQFFQSH